MAECVHEAVGAASRVGAAGVAGAGLMRERAGACRSKCGRRGETITNIVFYVGPALRRWE